MFCSSKVDKDGLINSLSTQLTGEFSVLKRYGSTFLLGLKLKPATSAGFKLSDPKRQNFEPNKRIDL
jgi:hypothetical protein